MTAQLQADNSEAVVLKTDSIRLWLADDKSKLLASFEAIGRGEQKMEVDDTERSNTNNTNGQGK